MSLKQLRPDGPIFILIYCWQRNKDKINILFYLWYCSQLWLMWTAKEHFTTYNFCCSIYVFTSRFALGPLNSIYEILFKFR